MDDMGGCAVVLASLLAIAAVVLVIVGAWTAGMFVGIAAAIIWAGILDPG
jgi:hypothetical protein